MDRETLARLLARYDVGALLDHRRASRGIENSNYFVTSAKGRVRYDWVLTVLERPSNAGSGYVPLLDLCHGAGLPVAPVVRNISGDAVERIGGRKAMLSPMLPGTHIDVPSVEQIEALGRFIGDFHRATRSPGFYVPNYPRDVRWLRERRSEVGRRVPDADVRLLARAVERVVDLLAGEEIPELPSGLVHGDLFRDNVLFEGPKLTGVIDFHHAARGYLVYDLAVAVNDWCSDADGALDVERASTLVRAYHGVRPLGRVEIDCFAGFLLYAALAFWLSRLTVGLARKSHQPPAADADASALRGRAPSSRFDVPSSTPASTSGPRPHAGRRLDALATNVGEICGLGADRISGARFKDPDEFRAIVADRIRPVQGFSTLL